MPTALATATIPSPQSEGLDAKTEQRDAQNQTYFANDLIALMSSCCQQGNYALVKNLLQANASLANIPDNSNVPPLHWAALNNRWHICKLLISLGADIKAINPNDGSTALHWAASKGHSAICSLLLDNGSEILAFDSAGYTSAHIASQKGHALVVALLMEWNIECLDVRDAFNRTPLLWASYKGHSATVQMLLNMGANVNAVDTGRATALHWALISDNCSLELVRLLLKAGANPSTKDGTEKTPSDWAILKERKWYQLALEESYISRSVKLKRFVGTTVLPHICLPLIASLYLSLNWKTASIFTVLFLVAGNFGLTKWLMRGTQMVATPFLQHFQWSLLIWPSFIYLIYFSRGTLLT